MSYSYPFEDHWSKQEIIDVVNFFSIVEKAYESGVKQDEVMIAYTRFKQIVPAKSEEKQLCAKFEKESGYSCYRTVQKAETLRSGQRLTMQ
ncbi:UPF0223 family protein [Radiobacillus sp. PE A8.2]|uniref:UPF0223 family protein n=1 Tax=Radiobacillus sp. PE A8.2 TaxID=3380349 RepID=UPI00388DFA03